MTSAIGLIGASKTRKQDDSTWSAFPPLLI